MRTRKLSVLLTDDEAVQFDSLLVTLGLSQKHRKQADADAELLKVLLAQYQALAADYRQISGKLRFDAEELLVHQNALIAARGEKAVPGKEGGASELNQPTSAPEPAAVA